MVSGLSHGDLGFQESFGGMGRVGWGWAMRCDWGAMRCRGDEKLEIQNHLFNRTSPFYNRIPCIINFLKKKPKANKNPTRSITTGWYRWPLQALCSLTVWVTTLTETGFPRDLLIQWTWVSFLGPHWVPLFIWLTVAQVLEQLEEQLSCWISAKTLKNGDDVLKGHSVFFLLHGTFS